MSSSDRAPRWCTQARIARARHAGSPAAAIAAATSSSVAPASASGPAAVPSTAAYADSRRLRLPPDLPPDFVADFVAGFSRGLAFTVNSPSTTFSVTV